MAFNARQEGAHYVDIFMEWLIVGIFFAACAGLNWLGPKLDAKLWLWRHGRA